MNKKIAHPRERRGDKRCTRDLNSSCRRLTPKKSPYCQDKEGNYCDDKIDGAVEKFGQKVDQARVSLVAWSRKEHREGHKTSPDLHLEDRWK